MARNVAAVIGPRDYLPGQLHMAESGRGIQGTQGKKLTERESKINDLLNDPNRPTHERCSPSLIPDKDGTDLPDASPAGIIRPCRSNDAGVLLGLPRPVVSHDAIERGRA